MEGSSIKMWRCTPCHSAKQWNKYTASAYYDHVSVRSDAADASSCLTKPSKAAVRHNSLLQDYVHKKELEKQGGFALRSLMFEF